MDAIDRKLLNMIQTEFPLVDTPFLELANDLDLSEEEVLSRLTELKRQNVVRLSFKFGQPRKHFLFRKV